VAQHTMGSRAEVLGVRQMSGQYTAASQTCATADCYQVEIYDFDHNATILAIVDIEAEQVRDVLYLPNAQPGVNRRLADRARMLASNHPEIVEALGFRPNSMEVAAPLGGMEGTNCDGRHLCVGLVYHQPGGLLWAIVDLTLEEVAAVLWTDMPPDPRPAVAPFVPESCPAPGTVERDGWSLAYHTTNWDGLRVHDISYNGMPVANNIKLVEWHIRYSSGSGFIDITGCQSGGGGFHIFPYGETQVLDLRDDNNQIIGFELVQDFRMSNWGSGCNYRYEQRIHFYHDGRFRVVSGAFGRGCGTIGVYRPVVRIDIAINGSENNSFASWDGGEWQTHAEEFWQLQSEPYTAEGYRWLVYNQDGTAYYIEPGQGQFAGSPEPDDGYIYVTRHRPEEGDTDLPAIGTCCNSDHRQGPHNYINGESIDGENIVIWYVPQMPKNGASPPYTCWTVSGEPNPETYPCFSGPMFVPVQPDATDHGVGLTPDVEPQTAAPGSTVSYSLAITNTGSLSDTFTFSASGHAWDVVVPAAVTLAAEASAAVQLTVTVPAEALAGATDALVLTATSAGDPAVSASTAITTTAAAVYGVELSTANLAQAGTPGSVISYTLTISNSGNISDTFALVLSDSQWLITAPDSLSLEAGAAAVVVVSVTIPATASNGQSDGVTVTVTSLAAPAATAAVTLQTTAVVDHHLLYLPLVIQE
jgi:hypothetical protein